MFKNLRDRLLANNCLVVALLLKQAARAVSGTASTARNGLAVAGRLMRDGRQGGPAERALAARGHVVPRSSSEEQQLLTAAIAESLDDSTGESGPPAPDSLEGSAGIGASSAAATASSQENVPPDTWALVGEPEGESDVDEICRGVADVALDAAASSAGANVHEVSIAACSGAAASASPPALPSAAEVDAADARARAAAARRVGVGVVGEAPPNTAVVLPIEVRLDTWPEQPDERFYAVWEIQGSAIWSGIHTGRETAAYFGLLRLAGDSFAALRWRRAASLGVAVQLYLRELGRHPTAFPTPRLFHW